MNELPPVGNYSRKATLDPRSALAAELKRIIEGVRFQGSQIDRFQVVHDDWPTFDESQMLPAACILPSDFKMDAWAASPHLFEHTWEPKGMPGWGLYKTAEVTSELVVLIRTDLRDERPIIMNAVEDAFQEPGMLMNHRLGAKYGLVRTLPEYYGIEARFALQSGNVIDNEDTAMKGRHDAGFTVAALTSKVQVGPVYPLALEIITAVNGEVT